MQDWVRQDLRDLGITDASAQLRCLYRVVDGRARVSSSPWLLFDNAEHRPPLPGYPVQDRRALDAGWAVPPRAGYYTVRTLLPSQALDSRTGGIRPRPLIDDAAVPADPDVTLKSLAQRYQPVLANIAAAHRHVFLGLSAGLDSRLVLAAAVAAGVADRLITYTYHRAPSTIALGDVTLPAQFSRAAGADGHLRLGPRRFEPARRRRVQALIGACDRGPATIPTYYTRGYTDAFPHGAVLLNGLTGELGRGFYRHLRPEATPDDLWRSHIPPTPVNRAALEELCHWWRLHPQPLDRRERFYWEARLASWASVDSWQLTALTQEQGLTYLSPLNCLTAFREILSLPEASRHRGQHVRALIEALCPALNAVLYNPPDPLPRRLARDLRRAYAYGMRRLQRCRQWVC